MSTNLRNYTKALYGFDHVLKLTPAKALAKKSPCAGWTGADVIEHALGGTKMVNAAATTGKMPKSYPKVGTDPFGAWSKLRDGTIAALDHPDVLESVAHTPFGEMPVDVFIGFMGADLIVHAWDLAKTAKVDDRLDPNLCKDTLALWKTLPDEMLRGPGLFDAAIKPAKGADAQTKLLNFLGRAV
jgi:uncharacterized protein (TIGR03086 family)